MFCFWSNTLICLFNLQLRYEQLVISTDSDEDFSIKRIPNFEIGVFPRAKEVDDKYLHIIVPASYIFIFALISKDLVTEKEKRIKDALLMMGLNVNAYSLSWAIIECLLTVPSAIAWACYLGFYMKFSINPVLLFIFIQTAAFSFALFAFLISSFFQQVKVIFSPCFLFLLIWL